MKLTKFNDNPLSSFFEDTNNFMRVFDSPFFTRSFSNMNAVSLDTDVFEADGNFNIISEIPGLNKEDIKVSYDSSNRFLSITAKSSYKKFEDKPNYHIRERSIGSSTRQFRIPSYVDAGSITSSIEDGILKISAPILPETNSVVDIEII